MSDYTEKRLEELRVMSADDVAACKIRKTTPSRVKAMILRARETVGHPLRASDDAKKSKHSASKGLLKDGDVLLKHNAGTFFNRLISGVTGSPYTHAALYSNGKIFDVRKFTGDKEKKALLGQGADINTVDEFIHREKGLTYDVYRPKDKKTAEEAQRNVERMATATKGYSKANAVQAGLRDRFGYGLTMNFDKNYKICSELVYDCFNGLLGNDASSSVSPGRLAKNKNLEKVDTLRLSIEELFKEKE